jgi:hypothetical protein
MSDESHPPTNPLIVLFVMGIVLVSIWFGLYGMLVVMMGNSDDVKFACVEPPGDSGC